MYFITVYEMVTFTLMKGKLLRCNALSVQSLILPDYSTLECTCIYPSFYKNMYLKKKYIFLCACGPYIHTGNEISLGHNALLEAIILSLSPHQQYVLTESCIIAFGSTL